MDPEINIGLVGHVDHGKSTLVEALSGEWTDQHSEEMKRGISIRLGYADATFYMEDGRYITEENKSEDAKPVRSVSFVDSPGHETLMATMLSGASLMDGAVLVIAADEECPQPQTKEHLMALEIVGVQNIVVAQNKIDLVSKERAKESKEEIENFLDGTVAEDAPIIPISAQRGINIELLIESIEKEIPTPERDINVNPKLLVARSFDINRPGTPVKQVKGGVAGGSISQGKLEVGDEIEIRPGFEEQDWKPIKTEVRSLMKGNESVDQATPGGLVGVGTSLDPSLTKSDALVGRVVGTTDLPPIREQLTMEIDILDRIVGEKVENINKGEALMLTIGTGTTVGAVIQTNNREVTLNLKRPVCVEKGGLAAINRREKSRWRLIGVGKIK